MATSQTLSSSNSLWYAILNNGSRSFHLSGTMGLDNICRLYVTDFRQEPPFQEAQLNPKLNMVKISIGAVDNGEPVKWLDYSERNCFCGHSGFRWLIQNSDKYSFSFKSDVWPTSLDIGPIGRLTENQYRFEIDEVLDHNQRHIIKIPFSSPGSFSCTIGDASRSFILTNIDLRLKKVLDAFKDQIAETDALYRLSTGLAHVFLMRESYDDQRFLESIMYDQEHVKGLQRIIWAYSSMKNHDPIQVANNLIRTSRPQGTGFSEIELVALSLAQSSSYLVVHLSATGEIDPDGGPYKCRHFTIHPKSKGEELRFFCTEFVIHTFGITPGEVLRDAVRFESLPHDTYGTATEIFKHEDAE